MEQITVTPMDVLHIITGRLLDAYKYTSSPPQNFSSQQLLKAIAQTYAFAEQLDTMITATQKTNEDEPKAETTN